MVVAETLEALAHRHAEEFTAALARHGIEHPGVDVIQIIVDPQWETIGPQGIVLVSSIPPTKLTAVLEHLAKRYRKLVTGRRVTRGGGRG